MTRFVFDSDMAIYAMIGLHVSLNDRLSQCSPGEVAISAISFAEIALGTANGEPPDPKILEAFVREIPLLPFDEAAARAYALLPFRRARFDRLLAAHAISLDATIVTSNELDFVDIPGLDIENWVL